MDSDLKSTLRALSVPSLLVLLMIASHILQLFGIFSIKYFGIFPLHLDGLQGVLLSVFAHKDWNHLISNAIPILILGWALFYYYREFAWKGLFLMWILTGFWVWLFARNNYHVGASGLAYSLAAFHVMSAVLRKVFRLMAFAMLVIFLYGGMVWGFFPELFPQSNISWESHLMGALAGIVVAFYFRNRGIQKPTLIYDDEDETVEELWYINLDDQAEEEEK